MYTNIKYVNIITVFCPRAGLPPQTQEPRLQLYQGLNRCDSLPLLSTLYYYYIAIRYIIFIIIYYIRLNFIYYITLGRRVIGISGSLIWSKTLMEPIFNPYGKFHLNPEGPVSQIHPWDLFRSFKVRSYAKEEWGEESNGKLLHLFIPSKTLVPEFAVEDLPLGRTATLVPELPVKDLPLGRTATLVPEHPVKDLPLGRTLWWCDDIIFYFLYQFYILLFYMLLVISIIVYYSLTAIQEVPGLIPGYTVEIFLEV